MKKILALVMAMMMVLGAVSAVAEETAVHLGMGAYTSISGSSDASADGDGKAQAYVYLASVAVDANGVITAAQLDAIQANIGFNAEGKITADKTAPVLTKNELLEGYGMKPVSPIGKEWYEQMEGLEAWLEGKTVADLKAAIEGNDETLLAVCTVSLDGIISALEKAVADAIGA